MDSVCFVKASHMWMDGARPVRRQQTIDTTQLTKHRTEVVDCTVDPGTWYQGTGYEKVSYDLTKSQSGNGDHTP